MLTRVQVIDPHVRPFNPSNTRAVGQLCHEEAGDLSHGVLRRGELSIKSQESNP